MTEIGIHGDGSEEGRKERAREAAESHLKRAKRESQGHEPGCRCWACLYMRRREVERSLPICAACLERMELHQKPWLRVCRENYHSTGSCAREAKKAFDKVQAHDDMEVGK